LPEEAGSFGELPPLVLAALVLLPLQPMALAPRNRAKATMLRIFFMETGPFAGVNKGNENQVDGRLFLERGF
jgi:hypothetical protein